MLNTTGTEPRLTTNRLRKMLTRNFSLAEFVKPSDVDEFRNHSMELLYEYRLQMVATALQQVRDELGFAINVTSGWRSKARNKAVGGSPTSDHPTGYAADVQSPFINAAKLGACFVSARKRGLLDFDQLIIYPRHVHISVNPRMRGQVFSHH